MKLSVVGLLHVWLFTDLSFVSPHQPTPCLFTYAQKLDINLQILQIKFGMQSTHEQLGLPISEPSEILMFNTTLRAYV